MDQTPLNVDYKGHRIAYRVIGEGRPMLVLHGWGTSSDVMVPLAKMMKDIRSFVLIDLPGFGRSPAPPRPWAIDDYADMVEAFLAQYPEKPVDILAHSFGGRVTLKLLSRTHLKTLIDKVVITGGAGLKPKRKPAYYLKKYSAKVLKAPFMLLPKAQREPSLEWLRTTALWKSLGSSDYQKLSGVMRETFVKSVTEYLDELLPGIDHDILLLWGRDDGSTPLAQGERMEKGLSKGALVVIDNAGHYAFLDRPKQFASITRAYLTASP